MLQYSIRPYFKQLRKVVAPFVFQDHITEPFTSSTLRRKITRNRSFRKSSWTNYLIRILCTKILNSSPYMHIVLCNCLLYIVIVRLLAWRRFNYAFKDTAMLSEFSLAEKIEKPPWFPVTNFFLIYKTTKTNTYLSFVDISGRVVYKTSAGSLGIRKSWERHTPATINKLLDNCFTYIKQNKIANSFTCQFGRRGKSFMFAVYSRAYKHYLKVRGYQFLPKRIHGKPLKKRRVKRL